MDADEPLTPLPAQGTRNGSPVLTAILAFAAGLVVMALGNYLYRGGDWFGAGAPAPAPMVQPSPERSATPAEMAPATDVATLSAREQGLAGRLDALEARLTGLDSAARNASTYASRAEALMVAFAARRALDRGQPLDYVEAQLRARFGASRPEDVAAILRAAEEPVTLEDLRLALDAIAPRLAAGAPDEGLLRTIRRQLGELVILRQDTTPSPRPDERLRRIRQRLDAGQVEAALAEVARMPGAGHAQSWMAAATRYVDSRRALTMIEEAAIGAPVPVPAPAPAAAPTPVPTPDT